MINYQNDEGCIKELLIEPIFRAMMAGGKTIEECYSMLITLAHEGEIWGQELSDVKKALQEERETKQLWDRFREVVSDQS